MCAVFDISGGICAYMSGGLGNQLFVLAAAWAQAERLGCQLYVDASWYRQPGSVREYELGDIDHLAYDITEVSPWAGINLLTPVDGEIPSGLHTVTGGALTLTLFKDLRSTWYDPRVETVPPGTTLVGYYQSPMYFTRVARQIREMLGSVELRPDETEYISEVSRDQRTTIQLRRGDYASIPRLRESFGITGPGYVARATALYERLHPGSRYRIVTDSPEAVAEEMEMVPGSKLAGDSGLRSIAAILAMAQSDGMIISNSTFAWWAAWLITARDPAATVIAPRPWFRNGDESAADLLLPTWLTVDARG